MRALTQAPIFERSTAASYAIGPWNDQPEADGYADLLGGAVERSRKAFQGRWRGLLVLTARRGAKPIQEYLLWVPARAIIGIVETPTQSVMAVGRGVDMGWAKHGHG